MSVVAPDSLFEVPGIGAVLKHAFVVIGFKDQHPASLEVLSHQPGGDAEIGGDPDLSFSGFNGEADRGRGIVGNGKGFHLHIPESKDFAGFEHPQTGDVADVG